MPQGWADAWAQSILERYGDGWRFSVRRPSRLAGLLNRGELRLHLGRFDRPALPGSGTAYWIDVSADCAILNAAGKPPSRLVAVEPLMWTAFSETVAVPDIRERFSPHAR